MPKLIDKSGNVVYLGRLSWGNLVDWLVTFCLGVGIALTTLWLGGVRPDTYALLLPLFGLLLVLHGLWLAVDDERPKRVSHVPLFFIPFLAWLCLNLAWVTPTAWRGWYELIYALQAFLFLWVIVNNVRTRVHLWVLIVIALSPALYALFIGFLQFFQDPSKLANAYAAYGLTLSPKFSGQATGSFADPASFVVFLLVLLPALLIAGLVRRLPTILRVLCLYISVMLLVGVFLAQMFWSVALVLPILVVVPWLCFQKTSRRVGFSVLGALLVLLVLLPVALFSPNFQERFSVAVSQDGEGVRAVLWQEAVSMALDAPMWGAGGGSYAVMFEQSPEVSLPNLPMTPHNDYLLILSQYGIVGLLLFLVPCVIVVWYAFRHWKAEPARVKLANTTSTIMPPTRFFLSIALSCVLSFAACLCCTFVFYTPALTLYGLLFFAILIKSSFTRRLRLPSGAGMRVAYLCIGLLCAWGFHHISASRIQAQAIELHARQRLDQLVEQRVHLSGNSALLNAVIEHYQTAAQLDPDNADVWIGLSAANCQLFFRQPAEYAQIGAEAAGYAQRAIALSDSYWMAWAQLGIAQSLRGDLPAAELALAKALSLAPNNSNAHYYWAVYQSHFEEKQADAIASVQRALEINPNNAAARRLQQKLLIL